MYKSLKAAQLAHSQRTLSVQVPGANSVPGESLAQPSRPPVQMAPAIAEPQSSKGGTKRGQRPQRSEEETNNNQRQSIVARSTAAYLAWTAAAEYAKLLNTKSNKKSTKSTKTSLVQLAKDAAGSLNDKVSFITSHLLPDDAVTELVAPYVEPGGGIPTVCPLDGCVKELRADNFSSVAKHLKDVHKNHHDVTTRASYLSALEALANVTEQLAPPVAGGAPLRKKKNVDIRFKGNYKNYCSTWTRQINSSAQLASDDDLHLFATLFAHCLDRCFQALLQHVETAKGGNGSNDAANATMIINDDEDDEDEEQDNVNN